MDKKLCFYTPPFPHIKSYYDMIDTAVEYGLNAVEGFCFFEFENPDIEAAKKLREYADKKNVTIPCFSVFAEFATERETIEKLKGYADVAKILGSPFLHHTIVGEFADASKVLPRKEELFQKGVLAVREIFDYAQSIGIRAIYEEQGYIYNGIEGFGRLIEEVDRNVGVVADFGNIYESSDDLLSFIEKFSDKIVHAHIKDVKLLDTNEGGTGFETMNGKYFFDAKVGEGDAKVKEAIELLKKVGYDGYYGLEFAADNDNSPLIRESIDLINTWL